MGESGLCYGSWASLRGVFGYAASVDHRLADGRGSGHSELPIRTRAKRIVHRGERQAKRDKHRSVKDFLGP